MEKNNYNIYYKPQTFMSLSKSLLPFCIFFMVVLGIISAYLGLVIAPSDYEQGETYKIIYMHVPLAWYSIMIYVFMALFSFIFLVWKHPLFLMLAKISAYIGLIITFLTLITGSLWGMPMWGTYWVWDARLTSVLILFFLYLAIYFLMQGNIADSLQRAESAAILAIFGTLNIPIIKYSVVWWNTLHQPASITAAKTSIHLLMLMPLFTTMLFLGFLILVIYIYQIRQSILENKIIVLKRKSY